MMVYNCSLPKCNLRIIVTRVEWHEVDGEYKPFCCRACSLRYALERKNEKEMADKNEAVQTSSEVSPDSFIKLHNALAQTTQARKVTQRTFEDLNLFW